MKEDLIQLIDDIPNIKKNFHVVGCDGMPSENVIYDVQEFQDWKQSVCLELQEITDRMSDQYISDLLTLFKKNMNGFNDEGVFIEMEGKLKAIKKNIDRYYVQERALDAMEANKTPKIFISHSTDDKAVVEKLVNLLREIGLNMDTIFCSSLPGYDIPIDTDIFNYIREQFLQHDLHVIFIHSDNYYTSPVSLNEMGAAWCLKTRATSILLPGFAFDKMKGVVNFSRIAIKLDNDIYEVKDKLNQLRNVVIEEFSLQHGSDATWEKARDEFINTANTICGEKTIVDEPTKNEPQLNEYEKQLLRKAADDQQGTILTPADLSNGTSIQVGNTILCTEATNRKEYAQWEAALTNLINLGLLQPAGYQGVMYKVTAAGYSFAETK